ncbi:MAG: hypothetical protein M1491_09240 [Deltaproteobacteria bacterium]|nr:hypothetical protein [Deltaproteobacteria bacterium]MCL5276786.1 hypothetical protein [Deltaproteobacteria bacterium]
MGNIHLIISNDNSYISSVVKKLVVQHIDREDAVESFDGKYAAPQQIDNALHTGSLISKNRAIVIHSIQSLKTDLIEDITAFLASPPENVLLIMTSDHPEVMKQKQFGTIQASRAVTRHVAVNKSTHSLLQDYIKEHDVRISPAAVDMLVDILEVGTWGIVENELNKLSTYAGRDKTIDETAVSELTFNLNRSDTFKLVNDVLAHRQKDALKDLKAVQETGGESAMVIGALAWKFRQLLASSNSRAFVKAIALLYGYSLDIRKGMIGNAMALDKLIIELLQQKIH